MPSLADHCSKLANPNVFAVGLAGFLVLGILVSYVPQHAKIITRRSSEGLSPWWVLLGGLSSIAAIGNILTLPSSRDDINCCKELSGGACAAALLGVAQIGCQWACFMFVVMLFLIFFPEAPDMISSATSITSTAPPKRRDALIVGVSTLVCLLTVGIASIAIVAVTPHHTQAWANFLGIVAGALSAVQYLPQIWYTFRLGDIKSLSIITMLIQVPGAFVFAFSLWLRVGWEGWSTWLVYIITGILQGTLLGLAISYWLARRKEDKNRASDLYDSDEGPDAVDGAAQERQASERTALLGSRRGTAKSIQKGSQRSRQGSNGRLDQSKMNTMHCLASLHSWVQIEPQISFVYSIGASYTMSDKTSSNTGSKGTPAIDRTKSGRVASGLKAAKKTIIGTPDKVGQRIRDDNKLAKGHGTTEADDIRGSNQKATHLTGVCSTTKYSRKNYLFLKIIVSEAPAKYDPPLVMAWQFQLALELVHEVCHVLFIARCGNVPEGDTDIFFRNDALAEVGFAMEIRLLGGHLSLTYDQDKVYDKGHSYHHDLALWARKSGPQMTKTKDIGWRVPLSWLEPFFTTAFWERTEPDLHFVRQVGRALKADTAGQREFASLSEEEKRELLPVGFRVREANGDIVRVRK
nr:hypothetical protein B0A51_05368 [Rachicladosporium sp. CCFEE 5018]